MTLREEFETWAKGTPRCWKIDRLDAEAPWPHQYRVWYVQNAWEAWQEAHVRQHALLDSVHRELQHLTPNRSTRGPIISAVSHLMHKVGRSFTRDSI